MFRLLSTSLAVVLVWLGGTTAHAQSRGDGNVAVSYSFLGEPGDGGINVPAGWLASFSRDVKPLLSIVGEAGGNYLFDDGETLGLHTFQAGIRLAGSTAGRARPYAQVLAGVAVASCCGEVAARAVIEPGGGVDVPLGRRTALRLGVGVPLTSGSDATTLVRIHTGITVDFGSHSKLLSR
jgi:hypothetical protein